MRQDVRDLDVVGEEGQLGRYAGRLFEHSGRVTGIPVLVVAFDREVSIDTKLCQVQSNRFSRITYSSAVIHGCLPRVELMRRSIVTSDL